MRPMNIIIMRKWNEIKLFLLWALILISVIYLLKATVFDISPKVVIVEEGEHEHPNKKELDVPDEEGHEDGLRRQILSPDNEFDQIKLHLDEVKQQMEHYVSGHNDHQLKFQEIRPLEETVKDQAPLPDNPDKQDDVQEMPEDFQENLKILNNMMQILNSIGMMKKNETENNLIDKPQQLMDLLTIK